MFCLCVMTFSHFLTTSHLTFGWWPECFIRQISFDNSVYLAKQKSKYKFIVFNTKDFYPSIKETLLIKAINFAEKLAHINKAKVIIKHPRKSLLYDNSGPWMKKDCRLFDVTMGTYDGVEVCELYTFNTRFLWNITITTLVFIAMMV